VFSDFFLLLGSRLVVSYSLPTREDYCRNSSQCNFIVLLSRIDLQLLKPRLILALRSRSAKMRLINNKLSRKVALGKCGSLKEGEVRKDIVYRRCGKTAQNHWGVLKKNVGYPI
jgi:hypothetical protein